MPEDIGAIGVIYLFIIIILITYPSDSVLLRLDSVEFF